MLLQNSIYRVLNIIVVFFTTLIISRAVGVEGYGILSLMITSGSIFNLFTSFGADAGITYHAASGNLPIRKIASVIHWILLLQLILLSIVELISFYLYGHFWLLKTDQLKQLWLAYVFLASISLTEKYSAILNGLHLFLLYSKTLFYSNIVILLVFGVIYFAFPAFSLMTYLIVYVLLYFMQAITFIMAYYKSGYNPFTLTSVNKADQRIFFTYSLITLITNSIQFLAYRIDYWILSYYRGELELGWYSLAVKLVQMFWVLPLVFAGIILPQIAATGKQFEQQKMLSLIRIMFLLNILAGAILFFPVAWIIPALFGASFEQSVLLFRILLPGVILFGGATIFAAYFAGMNRLGVNLFASSLCLGIILTLDILLIPSYGMTGAAVASSIGYGATTIFYVIKYKVENKISLFKIFIPDHNDWNRFRLFVTTFFAKK